MKTKYLLLFILLLAGLTGCRKYVITTVEGNVIDNQGNPIPNAEIEVIEEKLMEDGDWVGSSFASTTADEKGYFIFEDIKVVKNNTQYFVRATKEGFFSERIYIDEAKEEIFFQFILDHQANLELHLINTQNIYEKIIVQITNEIFLNQTNGIIDSEMIIGYDVDTILNFAVRKNQNSGIIWSLSLKESSTSSSEEHNDTIYVNSDSVSYTINY